MRQISPEIARNSRTDRDTYTLGGLLAFMIALPVVFVLLTAPQLVLAYVLGALSAVALRKAYLSIRRVSNDREQSSEQPADRRSRAQSR